MPACPFVTYTKTFLHEEWHLPGWPVTLCEEKAGYKGCLSACQHILFVITLQVLYTPGVSKMVKMADYQTTEVHFHEYLQEWVRVTHGRKLNIGKYYLDGRAKGRSMSRLKPIAMYLPPSWYTYIWITKQCLKKTLIRASIHTLPLPPNTRGRLVSVIFSFCNVALVALTIFIFFQNRSSFLI